MNPLLLCCVLWLRVLLYHIIRNIIRNPFSWVLRHKHLDSLIRYGSPHCTTVVAASATKASTAKIPTTSTSRLNYIQDHERTSSSSQHLQPLERADNLLLCLALPKEPSPTIASPIVPGGEAQGVENMGVIRKKTATRGGEGGVKYVCDVCSADITSTVGTPPCIYCPLARLGRVGANKRSCITLGPHPMRQSRLQRIRPLRPVLCRWRILT